LFWYGCVVSVWLCCFGLVVLFRSGCIVSVWLYCFGLVVLFRSGCVVSVWLCCFGVYQKSETFHISQTYNSTQNKEYLNKKPRTSTFWSGITFPTWIRSHIT
jgi:hypothetical protein